MKEYIVRQISSEHALVLSEKGGFLSKHILIIPPEEMRGLTAAQKDFWHQNRKGPPWIQAVFLLPVGIIKVGIARKKIRIEKKISGGYSWQEIIPLVLSIIKAHFHPQEECTVKPELLSGKPEIHPRYRSKKETR